MRTLTIIEDVCKVLEKHGVTVQESQRILSLTQQFLAVSFDMGAEDLEATPARVLDSAKERIKSIARKQP